MHLPLFGRGDRLETPELVDRVVLTASVTLHAMQHLGKKLQKVKHVYQESDYRSRDVTGT
jgi:hypothetical protein